MQSGLYYKGFIYEGDRTARVMGPLLRASKVSSEILKRACSAFAWSFERPELIRDSMDREPLDTLQVIKWMEGRSDDLIPRHVLDELKKGFCR